MICQPCIVPEKYITNKSKFTPFLIMQAVCHVYDIRMQQLTGKERKDHIVNARHMAMFVLRRKTDLSFDEIGRLLGNRDHTTAIYGCKKILNERGISNGLDIGEFHKKKYIEVIELLK